VWTLYRSCLEFTGEDSCTEVGVLTGTFQRHPNVEVCGVCTQPRHSDAVNISDVDESEVEADDV